MKENNLNPEKNKKYMTETHYYIISGMGADHRVFSRIKFPKAHTHLPWIENKPNESLQEYAARMAEDITHPNPIIIGLSFGGIMAQEIAALIPVKELILISTIKSKDEKPWFMGIAGTLHGPDMMPDSLLRRANKLMAYAFSLVNPDEQEVLQSCFENTSSAHLRWAMTQIANWEGIKIDTPIFHIHSYKDKVFSSNLSKSDAQIHGGHFAVYTNADELNKILSSKFEN
jgi:pimeloyl-ACP methyl ester carboxylesterase